MHIFVKFTVKVSFSHSPDDILFYTFSVTSAFVGNMQCVWKSRKRLYQKKYVCYVCANPPGILRFYYFSCLNFEISFRHVGYLYL